MEAALHTCLLIGKVFIPVYMFDLEYPNNTSYVLIQ